MCDDILFTRRKSRIDCFDLSPMSSKGLMTPPRPVIVQSFDDGQTECITTILPTRRGPYNYFDPWNSVTQWNAFTLSKVGWCSDNLANIHTNSGRTHNCVTIIMYSVVSKLISFSRYFLYKTNFFSNLPPSVNKESWIEYPASFQNSRFLYVPQLFICRNNMPMATFTLSMYIVTCAFS